MFKHKKSAKDGNDVSVMKVFQTRVFLWQFLLAWSTNKSHNETFFREQRDNLVKFMTSASASGLPEPHVTSSSPPQWLVRIYSKRAQSSGRQGPRSDPNTDTECLIPAEVSDEGGVILRVDRKGRGASDGGAGDDIEEGQVKRKTASEKEDRKSVV